MTSIAYSLVLDGAFHALASPSGPQLQRELLVENKRKRDAEAQIMNAHIYQWRFGGGYAADLFRNTAMTLETWRQP